MTSSFDLTGKVVVLVGAGLIGRAFARAIADHGATIVVSDVDAGRADEIASEVAEATGGHADSVALDIMSPDSVQAAIAELEARHGALDAVVNNAYPRNAHYGRAFFEVEHGDFCENVTMNLGGCFLAAQAFARVFRRQGFGNIVNVGSIYGSVTPRFEIYEGTPMTMPVEYAVIKSGLIHLTRYMARYLQGTGVRVNCLSPGGVLDGQPEAFLDAYRRHCTSKGMLAPDDLTGALIFLLADESRFVNGQNLVVDDGFTL